MVELEGSEFSVGRDPESALMIDHPSISKRHGRLLVRRGRLVVVDHGSRLGIKCGEDLIKAPRTLLDGELFEIGAVRARAWIRDPDQLHLVGSGVGRYSVVSELQSPDEDVRRFKAHDRQGHSAEVVLSTEHHDADGVPQWLDRATRAPQRPTRFLPEVLEHGEHGGYAYFVEAVAPGVRLHRIADAISAGTLRLPFEAAIVIVAQVAEAVSVLHGSFGPHGAVEPRMIALSVDGAVQLLRPSPHPKGYEDAVRRPFLAPERRYGARPTEEADVWSVGHLSQVLVGDFVHQLVWSQFFDSIVSSLRNPDPEARPRDLLEVAGEIRRAASAAGFDPSQSHVARVVRLMVAGGRPLARGSAPPPASA